MSNISFSDSPAPHIDPSPKKSETPKMGRKASIENVAEQQLSAIPSNTAKPATSSHTFDPWPKIPQPGMIFNQFTSLIQKNPPVKDPYGSLLLWADNQKIPHEKVQQIVKKMLVEWFYTYVKRVEVPEIAYQEFLHIRAYKELSDWLTRVQIPPKLLEKTLRAKK